MSEVLTSEQVHTQYSDHRKHIAAMEQDVLSRTVFVTQVRDLNQTGSLNMLRQFMEQTYGAVADCRETFSRVDALGKELCGFHPPGCNFATRRPRN